MKVMMVRMMMIYSGASCFVLRSSSVVFGAAVAVRNNVKHKDNTGHFVSLPK